MNDLSSINNVKWYKLISIFPHSSDNLDVAKKSTHKKSRGNIKVDFEKFTEMNNTRGKETTSAVLEYLNQRKNFFMKISFIYCFVNIIYGKLFCASFKKV